MTPAKKTAKKLAVSRQLKPREREVLGLMVSEGVRTPKQVAARLQIHPRTARQYVQRIRESGLLKLTGDPIGGVCGDSGETTARGRIRLHAAQICIEPIGGVSLKPRVLMDFNGCRVVVHQHLVEIYARENIVFYGRDENEAQEAFMEFFERLAHKLENDLNVLLVKPRAQNWRIVKAEWATEDSQVARRHVSEGVRLECFATEDGHRWLWGDWSKKTPEHETREKIDSEIVNRRLNDWRDWNPPTDSELYAMVGRIMQYQEQTGQQLRDIAATVKLLVKQFEPPREEEMPEGWRPYYAG